MRLSSWSKKARPGNADISIAFSDAKPSGPGWPVRIHILIYRSLPPQRWRATSWLPGGKPGLMLGQNAASRKAKAPAAEHLIISQYYENYRQQRLQQGHHL